MRAVLISPVMPASTGNGLAMRAGMWLEALASRFDTDVAVAALFAPPPDAEAFTSTHAVGVVRLTGRVGGTPGRPWLVPTLDDASAAVLRELVATADVVVVLRLYLAELVADARRADRAVVLDLDDLDWVREDRLGDHTESAAYLRMAADVLDGGVGRLVATTAAASDAEVVARTFPGQACLHVPNGVRAALSGTDAIQAPGRDIDLLFVATLGYAPNAEGAAWLVREVLPLLPGVRVALVGAAPTQEVLGLAGSGVTVAADVPDVAPWYARSRVCVVPVRVGAGTRIKIPEAWAHDRPVVSTTVGAEGIEHLGALLIADDAAAFAEACARLLADEAAGRELVDAGRRHLGLHTVDHAASRALAAVDMALGSPEGTPRMSDVTWLPQRRPGVEVTPIADGYLARDVDSDSVTWLNHTAYLLLALCTGHNDVGVIERAVTEAFDLNVPPAGVRAAMGDLVAAGLITPGSTGLEHAVIELALWAPNGVVAAEVVSATHRLLDELRDAGVTAAIAMDDQASVRVARNAAANRALRGSATHVLFLDATPEAVAAVLACDLPRLLTCAHEVIGIPVAIGPVSWERVASAARALSSVDDSALRAYAQVYDVSFASQMRPADLETGFVEARHCSSGALLVRRTALQRIAGSGTASRHRGNVLRGVLTMADGWGFFDPGLSAESIDIDEDLAFAERLRAAGGRLMIALSGEFGASIDVSRRLHAEAP